MRDLAAEHFERHTGSSWRPRSGSMVNHRALTSAMIDSRDFLAAKRPAETEVTLPAGPKVGLTGGAAFYDTKPVWEQLDWIRAITTEQGRRRDGKPMRADGIAP